MAKKNDIAPELKQKHQAFRRRLLTDDEIKAFTAHMSEFMGPAFVAMADVYGLSVEDSLRFQSLAVRLEEARTEKGLSLKEAAASLKVPKYKLDYIERTSMGNISPEIALRYIDFLGLTRWFYRWKKANAELAGRMGFVSSHKNKRS